MEERNLEIRKIWEQYKGQYAAGYIFKTYLKDFFNIDEKASLSGNVEFMKFVALIRLWKLEERRIQRKVGAENLTEEEMEKISDTNAKELTLLLQNTIADYKRAPEKFKQLAIGDISKLYQIIEKIQNDREKVEIQKNKLKLEAAKTFLPYTRMDRRSLLETRDLINEAIEQLVQLDANQLLTGKPGEGAELQKVE